MSRSFGIPKDFPEIICLCGSTKFIKEYNYWRKELTAKGKIVLAIEVVTTWTKETDPQYTDPELKEKLDELHKRKIDLADTVFFLNVDGYIGESTASEFVYAYRKIKNIQWLEMQGDSAYLTNESVKKIQKAKSVEVFV